MDRIAYLTKDISREARGIEIAPWHTPLVPRKRGYNALTLDILDGAALRARAEQDPDVPREKIADIDDVDLLGSATEIAALVGARGELGCYDYIVSSHNFEHLPNPVKFLRGCSEVLRKGGVLIMSIPDKRACFDYFRPHSTTGEFISAHLEDRQRPTPGQIFEHGDLFAHQTPPGGVPRYAFMRSDDPASVTASRELRQRYLEVERRWREGAEDYLDTHCWVLTPAAFFLVIVELRYLGLIGLDMAEVQATPGAEFYVKLVNNGLDTTIDEEPFFAFRQKLLLMIQDDIAESSPMVQGLQRSHQALQAELESLRRAAGKD